MRARTRDQAGDTLLEIIITVVIIGIAMSTLFYAFSTAASGSTIHQDLVTANGILRGYAEATKNAVKTTCPGTFNVAYTLTADQVAKGFTLNPATLNGQACPSTTGVTLVHIAVNLPNSEGTKTLDFDIRTP